jgi:hypothetical protein
VAIPAIDVGSIDEHGMTLLQADPHSYDGLPEFDEARFPTVRKLA